MYEINNESVSKLFWLSKITGHAAPIKWLKRLCLNQINNPVYVLVYVCISQMSRRVNARVYFWHRYYIVHICVCCCCCRFVTYHVKLNEHSNTCSCFPFFTSLLFSKSAITCSCSCCCCFLCSLFLIAFSVPIFSVISNEPKEATKYHERMQKQLHFCGWFIHHIKLRFKLQ